MQCPGERGALYPFGNFAGTHSERLSMKAVTISLPLTSQLKCTLVRSMHAYRGAVKDTRQEEAEA